MKKIAKLCFLLLNKMPMSNKFWFGNFIKKTKARLGKRLFGECHLSSNIRPHVKLVGMENIFLGTHSGIGDGARIIAKDSVKIGDNVLMAPDVVILTENHVVDQEKEILLSGTETKKVVIGSDVWIGIRVIILPGAEISDGCIIAAGAVVPGKYYPPYTYIGGNPAKVIKNRRTEE
ncbi:acyltransferase [Listeria sp. PSOL-1]|uniref:acyltransferase n=1 Tax=Listeria sp. PSOL-1 TaxID=1844999 RepID=UPI0013D1E2DC|nr:acyltransferase [Listeria sp. PSOL-1]